MARKEKPPRWQKGRHTFEVTLPADKTRSGKKETVKLAFKWEVRATKPMSARGWTKWEMECARNALDRATRAFGREAGFSAHDLDTALNHAVRAWCRTHLRGRGTSDADNQYAFTEKAPAALTQAYWRAHGAVQGLLRGATPSGDALAMARLAVEALLDASSCPPRNRRRFPAQVKAGRPVHKPRVRLGGWIDTGRYRPAQVLEVMADPPHIMKISYGDEVDEDFRPHIVEWKTIRRPARVPSLKNVFSTGDWIRHSRSGYGRVLAVRDSTMDVDYDGRLATLVPDGRLSKIEKVAYPEPADTRPIVERFPPGTWIRQDHFGEGVVLAVEDDILTVLLSDRIVRIAATGDGPVVWKLDRPPLDLALPREQRRMWWWRNDAARNGHRPCPCCGYPNLGIGDEFGIEAIQCIVCGWTDEWDGEEDADEVRPAPDPGDPLDWERPNWGYSLTEARWNFEERRIMFRSDDDRGGPLSRLADLRCSLVQALDRIMTVPAASRADAWRDIERTRRGILAEMVTASG